MPTPGTGPGGSMCRPSSWAGEHGPHVSTSGASVRSGARLRSASSSGPANTPSSTASVRPERKGGSSSSGGTCMIRNEVVMASGAVAVHACQASSTSDIRSSGQVNMPAVTCPWGNSRNSTAVTTP